MVRQADIRNSDDFEEGIKAAINWIHRNATWSREPCWEHIKISNEDFKLLKSGKIPEDKPRAKFKVRTRK